MQKPIQERVRAVILKDKGVVLIKTISSDREYWLLPGGGVEKGENKIEALKRECQEELGVNIKVGDLMGRFQLDEPDVIQDVHVYSCKLLDGTLGSGYDTKGKVELVPLNEIRDRVILPKETKEILLNPERIA